MAQPTTGRWLMTRNAHLKAPIVLLVILGALMSVTAVLFAYATKLVIDAAQDGESTLFIRFAIAVIGVLAFQMVVRALNHYLLGYYRAKTDKHLKASMFHEVLGQTHTALENAHTGKLMNHLQSDVRTVAEGMVELLPRFVFLFLRFGLAFALLFILDTTFALIMLAFGLTLLMGSVLVRNAIKQRHHAMQDAEASLRGTLQESLDHTTVIKAYEAETHTEAVVETQQQNFFHARMAKHRVSVFAGTALSGFFSAAYAFAIIYGAYRIGVGALTFGSLVAIIQLVEFMQSPFAGLSVLVPKVYAMTASAERLMKLEAAPKDVVAQRAEGTFDALVGQGITFTYGEGNVLNNLDFTARRGDMVHIKGASGIGKTTLFKVLLGLVEPTEGRVDIIIDGDSHRVGPATRRCFSYVPQGLMVQSGTIKDAIRYNTDADEDLIITAAKAAAIHDDILALEHGYDTELKERGKGFSEGQIQRLAIARSLCREASVLLFDEATSALDAETEAKVLANVAALEGKTVFVISHRDLDPSLINETITL